MKRTVVQRFDTLGGEESFLKGLLVKVVSRFFFFFFYCFFSFFRKETRGERETIEKCLYISERKKILEKLGKLSI